MKHGSHLTLAFLVVMVLCIQMTSAQFPIKMPKLPKVEKPKTEQPKSEGNSSPQNQPKQNSSNQNQSRTAQKTSGGHERIKRLEPTATPMFMKDALEIKIQSDNHYWKAPNQNDYTSWVPQVSFKVFFDNSTKLRYSAEWFNPDGSAWFNESLDAGPFSDDDQTVAISSPYSGDLFKSKAVTTTGTYGVKITNVKTSEVVFQGKFKAGKTSLADGDARLKNKFVFYVDNDWTLPIGYVGFTYSGETSWNGEIEPLVFMWFKGELEAKDMEARLFYNNQQVASTDDGGFTNTTQTRGEGCFLSRETCYYKLWEFSWKNFIIENGEYAGAKRSNVIYTEDKPGEYTVKIFYKGAQVREAKFTIDQKGWIAPNQFSDKIFLTEYKIAVPVKVMGALDKWNASAWKTDAFYGNPLAGFNVP